MLKGLSKAAAVAASKGGKRVLNRHASNVSDLSISPEDTFSGDASAHNQLMLDIQSSMESGLTVQEVIEERQTVRQSQLARRGARYRGDIVFPIDLQNAVESQIQKDANLPNVQANAVKLFEELHKTAKRLPKRKDYMGGVAKRYKPSSALAYLAVVMPYVYSSTLSVLTTTKQRLRMVGDWEPDRIIDYGSGTGAVAWAVDGVWGPQIQSGHMKGQAREYIGLDRLENMVEVASGILGALPSHAVYDESSGPSSLRLNAKVLQLTLPINETTLDKLELGRTTYHSPANKTGKRTLAIASFSFWDIRAANKRKALVQNMWDSGAEVIVLIDRGTPHGSNTIIEARNQLLQYGNRSFQEKMQDHTPGLAAQEKGTYALAPCPHDGVCPLQDSKRLFCHFTQNMQSPAFMKKVKKTDKPVASVAFSYIVIKRGKRPRGNVHSAQIEADSSPFSAEISKGDDGNPGESEDNILTRKVDQGSEDTNNLALYEKETLPDPSELRFPRIIRPPQKNPGHVVFEVCAASGQMERHVIPKSQGRQEYYDARKAFSGDSFPHKPKNGFDMVPPLGSILKKPEFKFDKFDKVAIKLENKKESRSPIVLEDPHELPKLPAPKDFSKMSQDEKDVDFIRKYLSGYAEYQLAKKQKIFKSVDTEELAKERTSILKERLAEIEIPRIISLMKEAREKEKEEANKAQERQMNPKTEGDRKAARAARAVQDQRELDLEEARIANQPLLASTKNIEVMKLRETFISDVRTGNVDTTALRKAGLLESGISGLLGLARLLGIPGRRETAADQQLLQEPKITTFESEDSENPQNPLPDGALVDSEEVRKVRMDALLAFRDELRNQRKQTVSPEAQMATSQPSNSEDVPTDVLGSSEGLKGKHQLFKLKMVDGRATWTVSEMTPLENYRMSKLMQNPNQGEMTSDASEEIYLAEELEGRVPGAENEYVGSGGGKKKLKSLE